MILLSPEELVPGQVVARDIVNPAMPQMILLRAGHALTHKTINALSRYRSEGVWVVDKNLAMVDLLINEEVERNLREISIQSYALWSAMEHAPESEIPIKPFEIMVEDTLALLRRIDLTLFPWVGNFSGEVFFGTHPAYVCLLSLALYRKCEKYIDEGFPGEVQSRRIASLLGMGALLHDIGNLQVPRNLLMELDTLTPSQMDEVRLHTEYGYKMLHDFAGAHAALCALHHHQNYDGSGYPKRRSGDDDRPLAGHKIPVCARLVSVVDTYVTLTSARPYSDPVPTFVAVAFVKQKAGVLFDPILAQGLLELIPPYLPGRRVTLSNGFQAVVVSLTPDRPDQPIVRTVVDPKGRWLPENRREDLALALREDISIVAYQGVPIKRGSSVSGRYTKSP